MARLTQQDRPRRSGPRARKEILLCLLVWALPFLANGQAFEIFNGTELTCSGAFLDSGGQGGSGYGNNENYTYTLCPDNPGDAISVDMLTFDLSTAGPAPIDMLTVYDGNSTAAPVLGSYTGNSLQGQIVSATSSNGSGCLTFVFNSNSSGTGIFAGTISCYVPCTRPVAAVDIGFQPPALICPGETVNFDGSPSTSAPGTQLVSYVWDFADGTTLTTPTPQASHTFTAVGEHLVQLQVIDDNGCSSVNLTDVAVRVGTAPTFTGTQGDLVGCLGEPLCLDGVVVPTTWNELPEADFGDGVYLPDNVGDCFTSDLFFTQFAPGQTLTNINQLLTICLDIEHSFIGDLVISVTSPSGENVILHQQGGGSTYLGDANDLDNNINPVPGTCWTYCFSPTASNGTWVDNSQLGATPNVVNASQGTSLAPGTYESVQSLNGLVGAQLNGTWTIEVCDLWAADNGFLCSWNIDFDPSLFPDLTEFTPVYGADCDSSYWSGPGIVQTGPDCNSICTSPGSTGDHDLTFTVTDNFGCTYDTVITVTVIPDPTVDAGPDQTTCDDPVQLNAQASGGLSTNCTYTLEQFDSYGDGWNGGQLTITVDGVPTSYTLSNGSSGTVSIPVAHGVPIQLSWQPGSFNGEVSFDLLDAGGTVVYSAGPGPASGTLWSGTTDCGPQAATFIYSWDPPTGLSDPSIADPIATVGATTTYCVTVTQAGHPECSATDCVTITVDAGVSAGTDAAVDLCAMDPAVDLFTLLGGADTGGTWTDPLNGPSPGLVDPASDPSGDYLYVVMGTGTCTATDTAMVTVNITAPPFAGNDAAVALCSSDAPTDLSTLIGAADPGGSWTGPGGVAFSGTLDPSSDPAGDYTYTVPGTAPCPDDLAVVSVVINDPPFAGNDAAITLCSSDAPVDLSTLIGAADPGGSWTGPGGVAFSGTLDPAVDLAGDYTYTVAGTAPCPDDLAVVSVVINTPPFAGNDAAITLCSSDAPVDLSNLSGAADPGGSWTGPGGVAFSGILDPASDPAGDYTYTVTGTAPCPDDLAVVSVVINTPPFAGNDAAITLCSSDAPVDLNSLIGAADPGGTWSKPGGTSFSGTLDPAVDPAGDYTYTVAGTAPCPDDLEVVSVVINDPPFAGTDGVIALCISSPPTPLFPVLGPGAGMGGTWSGPGGSAFNVVFDPSIHVSGTYVYSVPGNAPCLGDAASVTVNLVSQPDAGTPGAMLLCTSDPAQDLFSLLGGSPDSGGTWTDPNGVAFGGNFDPANDPAGTYTYIIAMPPPCVAQSSTVDISLAQPPDPGLDAAITLCISGSTQDLFAALGGSPDTGGTWSDPNGVAFGGNFDPATDLPGNYTYTVPGAGPCPDATAVVQVNVATEPDAGTPGAMLLCTSDPAQDLFSLLGGSPDPGGTWTDPNGVAFGGNFDPANDPAGTYTYTIAVPPPCVAQSSTVDISLAQPPDPGMDAAITLCISGSTQDLFAALGGSPDTGGTWSDPNGVAFSGNFDPATDMPGNYTYTVPGAGPCPDAAAVVQVNVATEPDAGTPGAMLLCTSDPAQDLFSLLGGSPDPGGTWTDPNGVAFGGNFDPANDPAGTYTYTIAVPPPCVAQSSTVDISLAQPPDPGMDAAITLCISGSTQDLFAALGGSPDTGGSWSDPNGVAFSGNFDPATDMPGNYTYTVPGAGPCPDAAAVVQVNVATEPDAGTPGAMLLCTSHPAQDLFSLLGGSPDPGGTWTDPNGVAFGGNFDPANDPAGTYTYTIAVPPPCVAQSSTVDISLAQPPDPGMDAAITLCISGSTQDLFAALGGSPDTGGTWSDPNGVAFGGNFDPATDLPGNYTYTVPGAGPCPDAAAVVQVTVTAQPDPGTGTVLNLCPAGSTTDLFDALGGSPDAGGTWTDPNGLAFPGPFDPAIDLPGAYTYTLTALPPCPSVSATIQVALVPEADAGTDGQLTFCSTGSLQALAMGLGGTPDPGGIWLAPGGVLHPGTFDPGMDSAGTYRYIVTVPPPCLNDTAEVLVNVIPAPDPGGSGQLVLCANAGTEDLFQALAGAPDGGGAWTYGGAVTDALFDPGIDAPGDYTYSLSGGAWCPDTSAMVNVSVEPLPDAGTDGSASICPEAPPFNLFNHLGGTPDPGGTWTDPFGAVFSGVFDPAQDAAGAYLYTVQGQAVCPDSSATATVTVFLTSPPEAGADIEECDLDAILSATGIWASGNWSGPAWVEFQDETDPFTPVTADHGGAATLVWSVTDSNGCAGADSLMVLFTEPLVLGTSTVDAICHGACDGEAGVIVSGGQGGPDDRTFQWSGGVAGPMDSLATGLCAGSYTVTVSDSIGCMATVPFVIGEPPVLVIDDVLMVDETCPGSCDGSLTVVDPEGASFSLDGGVTFQNDGQFTDLCPGTYPVLMLNAAGCEAEASGTVGSPPPVLAAFTANPDTVLVSDPLVAFHDLSSNATFYTWDFAGLGTSTLAEPSFVFPDVLGGTYTVCLTVSDLNGCTDIVCNPVVVLDLLDVHVPNAFSPDGDGTNDLFVPVFNTLVAVEDYEFLVFDRWGELLFESFRPGEGWSGIYQGSLVEQEVYVWKLTYKDGRSGEAKQVFGHVTVVR